MRVIGYRASLTEEKPEKILIEESTEAKCHTDKPDDILSFLIEPYENTIRVCWNLNDTISPVLRFIGKQNCTKLYQNKKCYIPPLQLFYIPDKVFSIKHIPSGYTSYFYGLDQYFPDDSPPSNAKQVKWLGEYLLEELEKMGLQPTKLTSPIAIYEQCIMRNFRIPTMKDMPQEVAEYALRCSGRLWIEAYQLGFWEQCFDYDIASSFPSAAKNLLDFRYGTWVNQSGYFQGNPVYQYCKCKKIRITSEISPIIYDEGGDNFTPTGSWSPYLTQQEIQFIEEWGLGTVEVEHSWAWIPSKRVKPLEAPLDKLLRYRGKNRVQDLLAKRISVGLYGKFGEERSHELGPYVNPIWFAEISTNVRLQVARFILENKLEDNLLHISVDGLLADRLVDVPFGWKVEEAQALIFSSGLVYMADKKPQGLNLRDVVGLVMANPRKGYYQRQILRTVSLADVIERDSWEDLGKVKPMYTSLDFYKTQHDRQFPKLPKTGEQLLNNKYKSKAREVKA